MLAKNFREASLSAQFLEIVDWILLAFEPQIAFESAGLGCWLNVISIKTPLGIPSIPSNIPDNLENTGRGLHGNHDISQSHNGNSKDRLVEEHDENDDDDIGGFTVGAIINILSELEDEILYDGIQEIR